MTPRLCKHMGCNKHPIYNAKGEKKGIYCKDHKKEQMVCVVLKKCIEDGCEITGKFNTKGLKKGLYCKAHKKEGMIDVLAKSCIEKDCDQRATFNKQGEKPKFCGLHKKKDMVDVRHKRCLEDGCDKEPSYGKAGTKTRMYCSEHKKSGMDYNIVHKTCNTPLCGVTPSSKQYEGYCMRCFIYTFPDKPVARNYKTKEKTVTDFINGEFPQFTIVTDKKIADGCSKKRPDILINFGDYVLIVEIDENQHREYDCSCENKRLMELSQDVGHIPIVFIRFNPDDYTVDGNKIKSCWGENGNGILVVKKGKKDEWDARLKVLKEQIQYWSQNKTEKTIEIVELFYDQSPKLGD